MGEHGIQIPESPERSANIGVETVASVFRGAPLRLPALLESVRRCRVFLLNAHQVLASLCMCLLSLALWPVLAQVFVMFLLKSLLDDANESILSGYSCFGSSDTARSNFALILDFICSCVSDNNVVHPVW